MRHDVTTSLTNLEALSKNKGFHWVHDIVKISPTLTGLLTGYLPTVILSVFMSLLPTILALLTRLEGATSESVVQCGVAEKYFQFQAGSRRCAVSLACASFTIVCCRSRSSTCSLSRRSPGRS